MKLLIFIFMFFLMVCSCNREKKATVNQENSNRSKVNIESNLLYEIHKIDSTTHLYLIYAMKSGIYYKIYSAKGAKKSDCEIIKLHEKYKLELDTVASKKGVFEHMVGLTLDNGYTVEFEGDSIRDLYVSKNLKGLCYYPDE